MTRITAKNRAVILYLSPGHRIDGNTKLDIIRPLNGYTHFTGKYQGGLRSYSFRLVRATGVTK